MSKAKRVMQQNKRAAFVLDVTVDEFFQAHVMSRLSAKGVKRILRWSGGQS